MGQDDTRGKIVFCSNNITYIVQVAALLKV